VATLGNPDEVWAIPMRRTVLGLILLLAATGGAAGAQIGTLSRSAAAVTAEGLLAADVPWSTVREVAGPRWWPEPPSFDTVVYQDDPMPKAAVTQTFSEVNGKGRIVTRLYAYGSRDDSAAYLSNATLVGDVIDHGSPAVGDDHAFYRTTLPDGMPATRFLFTRGRVAVAIQVDSRWTKGDMARLARPIDDRVEALLAGRLAPPAIPAATLARLPRNAAGQVLGTALIPAEAWAMSLRNGNRLQLRDTLVQGGSGTLAFRRYLRDGSRSEVLETTLFAFRSGSAAAAWFAPFRAGVAKNAKTSLNPGSTGGRAAFRYQFTNYELQFVAGKYVGDVFCWTPYAGEPSRECEQAVRKLAERWYTQLAR
jgi:hypothetical protein